MQNSQNYSVAIIILNYKTPHLVIDCIESISNTIPENNFYVVVVDNYSEDNSINIISDAIKINGWSDWVELVCSDINGGFSSGNNLGISSVSAEYYLLLNSDTLVTDQAISKLFDFATANPQLGLVTPNLIWPDGELQTNGFRNIHPVSELIRTAGVGFITKLLKNYDVPIKPGLVTTYPDWICFACVLIKKDVLQVVGELDENYFMYFEDVDYCRRATKHGFSIATYPDAKVIHLNGGSSGINSKNSDKRKDLPEYFYASRAKYFKKFYGKKGLLFANLLWVLGRSISLLREVLGGRGPHLSNNEYIKIWQRY